MKWLIPILLGVSLLGPSRQWVLQPIGAMSVEADARDAEQSGMIALGDSLKAITGPSTVGSSVEQPSRPREFRSLGIQTVTAYSEFDSCHFENCIMANGESAYAGAIACPRTLAFGVWVTIDGKPFICKDRTSVEYEGRFDIFTGYGSEAHEVAKRFGVQKKLVQFYGNTSSME